MKDGQWQGWKSLLLPLAPRRGYMTYMQSARITGGAINKTLPFMSGHAVTR